MIYLHLPILKGLEFKRKNVFHRGDELSSCGFLGRLTVWQSQLPWRAWNWIRDKVWMNSQRVQRGHALRWIQNKKLLNERHFIGVGTRHDELDINRRHFLKVYFLEIRKSFDTL